jgi:predicted RND superfamily exporter protein
MANPGNQMTARFEWLHEHAKVVLTALLLVTAVLIVPLLALAPDESASTEPTGDVFTARDRIDDRFLSSVHAAFFIAEHESGDLLRAAPLVELLDAQERLRADPAIGPTLLSYFEVEARVDVTAVVNLADVVAAELGSNGVDLVAASDAEVKAAGAAVIERFGERSDLLGISAQSTRDSDGDWMIPAVWFPVLSNDDILGFGNTSVNLGGDTDVEEYDRDVQDLLRTADGFQVNGVAIDLNLTSQEQGAIAGPFIGFTILAVLLLVGLTFRSYWVLATVSVAFMMLLIWLKGITNLIGFEDDLVLSLIVPVAMISFGVDFAFHAIGRYREQRADGLVAKPAFVTGLVAVSGALVLALATDAVAFLANVTSGIESINQFGIGAAIALGSAYLLLGITTPLILAQIEAAVPPPLAGRSSTWKRVGAAAGASAMTMVSVLLLVFVLPWLGAILSVVTALVVLVVPYRIQRRKLNGPAVGDLPVSGNDTTLAKPVGRAIASIAAKPGIVLPAAVALTAVAAVFAVQVPAEFDVEDFFATDTDFVVGLDQLTDHVGDRGGEPALVLIEGDLTDPARLSALRGRVDEIRALPTPSLARDDDGVTVDGGIFSVIDETWASRPMLGLIAQQTGVELTDDNGDMIPDTREQMTALLNVASQIGVPFNETQLVLTPDDVNTAIVRGDPFDSTVLELGLVDSREQQSVTDAKNDLEPIAAAISGDMGGTFVQVTGSPFVREASLDATSRALQVSLPVALVLCLLIGSVFLRSIRYGLASIVPILMVIAWLYAFMEIAGFSINIVTATIAAVSIGIGIDFAIHFISRYRSELARLGRRHDAVQKAGEGTGLALVASALSSSVGFGLLALAPMPLFAAYGLLTALMILLALVATLVVLPSLLVLITRDSSPAVD